MKAKSQSSTKSAPRRRGANPSPQAELPLGELSRRGRELLDLVAQHSALWATMPDETINPRLRRRQQDRADTLAGQLDDLCRAIANPRSRATDADRLVAGVYLHDSFGGDVAALIVPLLRHVGVTAEQLGYKACAGDLDVLLPRSQKETAKHRRVVAKRRKVVREMRAAVATAA